MKPATEKRQPTPAERRRVQVARERFARHMPGLLDGLNRETGIETCRVGIRALSKLALSLGGEGRAAGVLCGALVDVSPGYAAEAPARTAAEALFARPKSEEPQS